MKIQFLSTVLLLLTIVLLCGCSSAKFTEYHGNQVIVGQVGTPRAVDGVDFWENGIPGRKYKILGTITTSRKQHLPLGRMSQAFSGSDDSDKKDSATAKIAHKHGGDAVIFVRGSADQSDSDDSGNRKHQRMTLVVIKYLE
jgi:hypothetical protein